jgi:hypothetical protein
MPNVFAEEGKTVTSAYLEGRELFIDVDGDPLRYEPIPDLSSPDYDESADFRIRYIPSNQTLEASLSPFSDWTGTVPIKMFCYDSAEPDYEHDPSVKFSVFVNNTNDGPVWLDVPTYTIEEGSARNDLVKLTDLVFDIDTSASSMKFFIEGYTNTTFVYLKIFDVNGAPYIGIEPRWIDWYGETNVRVSVSDGEFSETTIIRIVVTPVNDLPTVQINEPLPDAMVQNGPLSIVGQAFDVEGIKRVEVFYDGKWNLAKGTNYWGYTVDIPKLGEVLEDVEIQVRAYDGESYANASIMISIDRYLPPVDLDWDDDGYNNDEDDFPYDPSEWSDLDGDKVGDNTDRFPDNPNLQFDMDEDTYGDQIDTHPFDPLLWNDQDGDGFNDEEIITYRNKNGNEPTDDGSSMLVPILLWTLAAMMLLVAALSGVAYFRKKSAARDPVRSARYVARLRKRRMMVHDLTEKLPLVHASKKFESLITGSDSSAPAISPHVHGMPMRTGMKPAPVRPSLPSGPMNMARPPFKP